jgi:hypothetical protein
MAEVTEEFHQNQDAAKRFKGGQGQKRKQPGSAAIPSASPSSFSPTFYTESDGNDTPSFQSHSYANIHTHGHAGISHRNPAAVYHQPPSLQPWQTPQVQDSPIIGHDDFQGNQKFNVNGQLGVHPQVPHGGPGGVLTEVSPLHWFV